jgi:hypothetical protein
MATMKEALMAVLTGDATLGGLTTKILNSDDFGRKGLQRSDIVDGGGVAIAPALYVKWSTETPFGTAQRILRAERRFFEVWGYEDDGYGIIRQMLERVKVLLEYQPVQFDEPAGVHMSDIFWAGDVLGEIDESLGNACMERSRYQALLTRS